MLKHLLQGDICSIVISFLNIYSICTLLQISKEFRSLIDKCKLKNKKRVELKALPQNSILFEGICYFKIWYDEDLSNIPIKQNDTHLIHIRRCVWRDINISTFSHVHMLDLSFCEEITNESLIYLSNIHTLHLSFCYQITDVSSLSRVCNLSLYNCFNIIDVSPLANVRGLDLQGCKNVSNVSDLINVLTLNLNACEMITDVSKLINLRNLYIKWCTGISHENIRLLKENNPDVEIFDNKFHMNYLD